MLLSWLLLLLTVSHVHANVKGVFAHFMVSNTGSYTIADWENDISLARAAHIDGFALNMAKDEVTNGDSLANAFIAAQNLGSSFKLFFSFDYAGNGLWPKADVIALIRKYSSHPAYYHRGSQPLVSTFEGPAASDDWSDIKLLTHCFFIPSWSSLGAKPAWELGKADGLFSWAAWPTGPNNMDTFTDASYLDTLNGSPYMMGVAPWFYTNLPGFRKNWLWRGDDLWFDRWTHVMYLQPEYVEIITWNDYGESHYIGPLRDNVYTAFDIGKAPFNYALGKAHDAWRIFLPYLIDMAKTNSTSFSQENVIAWYRPSAKSACGTGGTTGNTASQLQPVFAPGDLVEDRVFYAALLGSPATVTVSIGGVASAGEWTYKPSNGIGVYRGSVPFNGRTGDVVVTISRGGQILQASGDPITTCTQENWNHYTIQSPGNSISAVSPLSLSEIGCTKGFGAKKYQGLCEFACKYDYCPKGACTCTELGTVNPKPPSKDLNGCPALGIDSTFLGLCSFGCNYGFCPKACKVYPTEHKCLAPNPTAPPIPVCISGQADGDYALLCAFTCAHGVCPPEVCTCTEAGTTLPPEPDLQDGIGTPVGSWDYGVCSWACAHGVCPSKLCKCTGASCPVTDPPPSSFDKTTEQQVTATIKHDLGQYCDRQRDCTNQDDRAASACSAGLVKLGWDKGGCKKKGEGKSICCASGTSLRPDTCIWRGDGGDCNGQCHNGETTVIKSSWGGGPTKGNNKKCSRGVKAFCCSSADFDLATQGCIWSNCGQNCDSGFETLASDNNCNLWKTSRRLCCPKPALVSDCVWRGTLSDCANAKCNNDEVAIGLSLIGDLEGACDWGRQRTNCCKISVPAPPPPPQCDYDVCTAVPALSLCFDDDTTGDAISKRESCPQFLESIGDHDYCPAEDSTLHSFEKRGTRPVNIFVNGKNAFQAISRPYSSRKKFIANARRAHRSFFVYLVQPVCIFFNLQVSDWLDNPQDPPKDVETEHVIDLQVVGKFIGSCISGILPDGTESAYTPMTQDWWATTFQKPGTMPAQLPRVTETSPILTVPMDRLMEVFGSDTNYKAMVLLEKSTNVIKGALFGLTAPYSSDKFAKAVQNSVFEGADTDIWLTYLHRGVAVSKYLNEKHISDIFVDMVANAGTQLDLIERNTLGASHLRDRWLEFAGTFFPQVEQFTKGYLLARTQYAIRLYERHHPADYGTIMVTLTNIISGIADWKTPYSGE